MANKNFDPKNNCENSDCVGRKVSFEKSATGFSVKLGGRRSQVTQEFDAFVSNVGVDMARYCINLELYIQW